MISIIIPALNEEKYLRNVIKNIVTAQKDVGTIPIDIIIVNDASTDKTPQIIRALEKRYPFVRSIHHTANQGMGTGFREAVQIAKYPKLMVVPGDNDTAQSLIKKMFLHRNDAEVLFSYYLNKEMRGRVRNILSTLYGLLYMTVFNVYIQYINCVAIYPTKKLQKLDIKSRRFSIIAEVNIKLLCSGCHYYEIAGDMQTGLDKSTSIKLKNIIEVIVTFIKLVYEIKLTNRYLFNRRPIRIKVDD